MRSFRAVVSVVAAVVALSTLGIAGCSSDDAATRESWVGTWSGDYDFSMPDGTSASSSLTIVIERQDGDLVWGHEEFIDQGTTVKIPVNGSVDTDHRGIGLAATGLIFDGTLTKSDTMSMQFFKVTDPATAFSVMLELQS